MAKKPFISKSTREFILRRDSYQCQRCGVRCERVEWTEPWSPFRKRVSFGRLQIDHVVPVADGGSPRDPANLQALCDTCNQKKGGMPVRYRWDGTKGVSEWLG